ncbi:NatC N(alpha)-terminal acetyltransferase Mak10 subunit [Penicillium maclennaniae]|uniref:NatC N(alpha)-terminal acetyltransferase Mak10 subunit n=1 Tax=Penicillium maclennaniae TaxID=1343394 RepID=UPI002540F260|nr:NatC N(alpha)-terminal acetyltransferase Mak10 subunit [Penicillium maclennaniae]KAJ5684518.1 NatC N(alpha)-terminal acetyltransferase Mak10 subunit [Penicillium maclennaniae]
MLPNNEVRVPPPRAAQSVPRDITAEFTEAASKLRTGQLVKDEYFTLFESVGALEIMDPKMDSGYIAPGESHAQALEDDYDVRQDLTPEQVVGLMDQLLCHEMAWHMGHPLSQTLFTSIYLDRLLWPVPRTIEDARFDRVPSDSPLISVVLRAYCLGLIKACDFVHARIVTEYFYEEEDFVSQLYNRNLLSLFDSSHFYRLLDQAVAWLDDEKEMNKDIRDAIRCRLLFRREFLCALDGDLEVLDTRSTDNFSSCLSHLAALTESVSLGKAVPEAFSMKIQRKLASTVPPRPIVNISTTVALTHLQRLCQDAIDLQQMLDYTGPTNFKTAVWTLLARKPQPSVYIRSLLQALIVCEMTILGAVSVKQFLYDDLAELVLPANLLLEANTDDVELPTDPRFQIAQQMNAFVRRFAQPFVDTVRSACLNRCRVRRTLCHTVENWDGLQMEAEDIDLQIQPLTREPGFSGKSSKWDSSSQCIPREELPGMYWYLSHICSAHLGHIDRIRTFTVAARKHDLVMTNNRGSNAAEKSAAFHKSFQILERLTTQLIAVDAFAIALHSLYALLARHKILPSTSSPEAYSSDKLRYELRMKPFIPISLPELVPFEEYQREATLEGDTDATVLDRASKAITEARKAWEATLAHGAFIEDPTAPTSRPPTAIEEDWKRDIKDTMRACIGASIAIETVKKTITGDSSNGEAAGDDPRDRLQDSLA